MKPATRYFYRPALVAYREGSDLLHGLLEYVGETFLMFWQVAGSLWRSGDPTDAMANIGVNSIPITLITITFSGMVLALYTASQFVTQGLGGLVGGLVGLTMSRELAPVLAALVVAGRAGSAMAAEIGTMKVTEQIDALRSLATSPVQYLVVPRFIACVTMLPILALVGMVVGTFGAYWVASFEGISRNLFFDSILQYVSVMDVLTGMFKTVVFGAIIAIVACHQGLNARGGASGVGQATTRSVVLCIVFVYIADFMIVRLFVGWLQ